MQGRPPYPPAPPLRRAKRPRVGPLRGATQRHYSALLEKPRTPFTSSTHWAVDRQDATIAAPSSRWAAAGFPTALAPVQPGPLLAVAEAWPSTHTHAHVLRAHPLPPRTARPGREPPSLHPTAVSCAPCPGVLAVVAPARCTILARVPKSPIQANLPLTLPGPCILPLPPHPLIPGLHP